MPLLTLKTNIIMPIITMHKIPLPPQLYNIVIIITNNSILTANNTSNKINNKLTESPATYP